MKGIVSYDQLNSVVQSINTAVTAKYKILHQSMKNLNSHARKLHKQFKDQETKDTKGNDIKFSLSSCHKILTEVTKVQILSKTCTEEW